jgi:hypothetical protein
MADHYVFLCFVLTNHKRWLHFFMLFVPVTHLALEDSIKLFCICILVCSLTYSNHFFQMDSLEKLTALLDACSELGVDTGPKTIGDLGIIPLFSWYHKVCLFFLNSLSYVFQPDHNAPCR